MKITSKLITSAFVALTFVAVPACDEKKEDKKADKKADAKDAKDAKKAEDKKAADDGKAEAKADEGGDKPAEGGDAEPADEGGSGGPAAEGGGDAAATEIGVPECDDYFKNYMKCIDDKMPEAARAATKSALETSFEAWRKAAETPAGKEGLVVACKTASDAVKATCGW